jgi:hypothetical protein
MWGWSWHVDLYWLAVCGAIIMLVGVIGLGLMQAAMARTRRLHREHRELALENERLAAHHDRAGGAEPGVAAPVETRTAAPAAPMGERRVTDNRMHTARPAEPVRADGTYPPAAGGDAYGGLPVEEPHPHRRGFAAWRQHARR